jgi:cytochrome P450 family 110
MILPNGPRSPKLIELIKLGTNPYEYLYNCSQRYGECFKIGGTKNPTVFFSNPQGERNHF